MRSQLEGASSANVRGVARQQLRELGDRRIALRQIVERRVARVAGVAMLLRPAAAGLVVLGEGADRMRELAEKRFVGDLGLVEPGGEQGAGHSAAAAGAQLRS